MTATGNFLGYVQNVWFDVAEVIGFPMTMYGDHSIDFKEFEKTTLQERINWARNRQTTRPEDRAYSLLGLLDVSMPMIYGEGVKKAFKRLNREVKEEHGVELNFEGFY